MTVYAESGSKVYFESAEVQSVMGAANDVPTFITLFAVNIYSSFPSQVLS